MLISLLNSHPNIHAEGEIFNRLNGRDYGTILQNVFAEPPPNIKAKGFKLFYYHPLDDKSSDLWETLSTIKDLYVIHLKRKNILRTLISRKIADINNEWYALNQQKQSNNNNKISFTLTVNELKKGFTQTRQWESEKEKLFESQPLIVINYEDLVNQLEDVFGCITDFLGVQYNKPSTKLKKQNPKKMKDYLENYEDLKLAFSGTEWQDFFED
jgi:LPS sulfotransferase NodH